MQHESGVQDKGGATSWRGGGGGKEKQQVKLKDNLETGYIYLNHAYVSPKTKPLSCAPTLSIHGQTPSVLINLLGTTL